MTIGEWFSVHGHIGRRRWWLAYLLPVIGGGVLLGFAYGVAAGLLAGRSPPATDQPAPLFLLSGLIALLTLWPLLAGSIKRLHDRDRPGWWLGLQQLLVMSLALLAWQVQRLRRRHEPLVIAAPLGAAMGVALLGLWLFVEIYVLHGMPGPNRSGDDPLGPATPVWRQQASQQSLPLPRPLGTWRGSTGRRG